MKTPIALALNAFTAYMLTPPTSTLDSDMKARLDVQASGVARYGLWSCVEPGAFRTSRERRVQPEKFQLDLAALALVLVDAKRGR